MTHLHFKANLRVNQHLPQHVIDWVATRRAYIEQQVKLNPPDIKEICSRFLADLVSLKNELYYISEIACEAIDSAKQSTNKTNIAQSKIFANNLQVDDLLGDLDAISNELGKLK